VAIVFTTSRSQSNDPGFFVGTRQADALCDFLWPLFKEKGEFLDHYSDGRLDEWQLAEIVNFLLSTSGGDKFTKERDFLEHARQKGESVFFSGE